MNPSARFHGTISTMTIFIMFWAISYLAPTLAAYPAMTAAGGLLGSIAVYRLLALGLAWILDRWLWAKRHVFGPEFLEGTWVGHFVGHAGSTRLMVEHYIQDFHGLVVKGRSFTDQRQEHGYWTSEAATIDTRKGRLVFTYSFDVVSRSAGLAGISTLDFERSSARKPPTALSGFSHDLNDPTRIAVHAEKISDRLVGWSTALDTAARKFLP
jgi:hypothetical protein